MNAGKAAAWLSARPGGTGLFTDFDGTLSDIVPYPEQARPLPGAAALLKSLAATFGVVAVVSGRPVSFLIDRLDLRSPGRLHAYGLHGLQHTIGGEIELAPGLAEWVPPMASVVAAAPALSGMGVVVEDKGFGVTMHWRNAADRARAEAAARPVVEGAAAAGLIPRPGKMSVELVPPLGVNKGTVVADWAAAVRLERVAFIGDDLGDVIAFEAIDALGEGVEGLKIAVTSPEAPEMLLDSADLVLPNPAAALALLMRIAELVT